MRSSVRSVPAAWRVALLVASALVFCSLLPLASDTPSGPELFPTAEGAWQAFVAAAGQKDLAGLKVLLGPGHGDLFTSGDPVGDEQARLRFLEAVREKAALTSLGANRVMVLIGKENWPFPIPIVKVARGWCLDAATGAEEILNRRIGKNELFTIEVLHTVVGAQEAFAKMHKEPHYAQRLASTEGARDGLYWKATPGEPESPLGPLVAAARGEGYEGKGAGEVRPFHGYLFKILTAQGKDAPGGEKSYLDKEGKMTGGFALVAWPASYGASGIMTFIVGRQGVVFQRDLGPKTDEAVATMPAYNPGPNWDLVKD